MVANRNEIPAHTLAGFHAGCLNGDQSALSAWADALEQTGDGASAALLRQLTPARDEIAPLVQAWRDTYPGDTRVDFYLPVGRAPYWFCGDGEQEGDVGSRVVGALMGQWDQFYPALEWLARDVGLLFVEVRSRPATGGNGQTFGTIVRLGAGEHFGPAADGQVVSHISLREYDWDDVGSGGN